jgi:MFS family permease
VSAAGAGEAGLPARSLPRFLATTGTLAVVGLVAVDIAAVPTVLPSVRVELGSSSSGLVWVQAAYLLALAVTLMLVLCTGADRRLLAAVGATVFAGGALLASTADETATLVTGRAIQGVGMGALLLPALESLRLGERRRLLFAGAGALLALALAPLAGGAVAEEASWPWLFRIEVAGAAAALLVAAASGWPGSGRSPVRGSHAERGSASHAERGSASHAERGSASHADRGTASHADRGTASHAERGSGSPQGRPLHAGRSTAFAAGLILAVTGLVQSGPWGWASADTLLLLAGGAALIVVAQRELPAGADAVALVLAGCLAVGLLLAPQYLELVRGLSPLRSGVLTAVLTVSAATLVAVARLLAGRVPPRVPVIGGLACAALGALGMTRIDPASSYALVVISLGLLGSGVGGAVGGVGPLGHAYGASEGPHSVADPVRLAAAAAAGAALIVAAAGALLQRAQLEEREGGGSFEDALAAGLAASGWLMAALLAAAAVLAWRRASSSSP